MKAYYYSFLFEKKIEVFFKNLNFLQNNVFFYVYLFWIFLFSANIMFDFNKWGLKWNDRIPSICFSKKNYIFLNGWDYYLSFFFPCNFFFQQMRSQMKAGYYCLSFWGKKSDFFNFDEKKLKNPRKGGTYAQNVMTLNFFGNFFYRKFYKYSKLI